MKEQYKKDDLEIRMIQGELSSISFMIRTDNFILGWLKENAKFSELDDIVEEKLLKAVTAMSSLKASWQVINEIQILETSY